MLDLQSICNILDLTSLLHILCSVHDQNIAHSGPWHRQTLQRKYNIFSAATVKDIHSVLCRRGQIFTSHKSHVDVQLNANV